jgi:hypothetical protein
MGLWKGLVEDLLVLYAKSNIHPDIAKANTNGILAHIHTSVDCLIPIALFVEWVEDIRASLPNDNTSTDLQFKVFYIFFFPSPLPLLLYLSFSSSLVLTLNHVAIW